MSQFNKNLNSILFSKILYNGNGYYLVFLINKENSIEIQLRKKKLDLKNSSLIEFWERMYNKKSRWYRKLQYSTLFMYI